MRGPLRGVDGWSASATAVCLLLLLPLVVLMLRMGQPGPMWEHISETLLTGYVLNTLWLIVTVSIFSFLMAAPAAWLLSTFEVPGRRWLEWAMVLPLAIPTYVAAFVYMRVPEAAIPLLIRIRSAWGVEAYLFAEAFLRKGLLVLLLAGVLYPYLYLSLRASFMVQRRGLIEAAHLLGRSPASVFFTVALPLARPALIAGLSLIVMEVLNDYGAVYFFGVPTLTQGMFRVWTGLDDLASAVRLAGWMLIGMLVLLAGESLQRGRARFAEPAGNSPPLFHRPLRPLPAAAALLCCLLPLAIGFLLPLIQLLIWAALSLDGFGDSGMWRRLTHSLLLSLGTAAVLTVVSVLLVYAQRLHPVSRLRHLIRLAGLGYAVPGAVVAVAVMVLFGMLESRFSWLHLSGTVFAIGFAYVVRFLAVSLQPVRAAMDRVCGSLDAASRTLGQSPMNTLFQVNLPLIRGTLFSATMLVFVDILKELPLTMILRPVNFDTLATLSFGLAKEGRIQECAIPSLMIVVLAGFGLFGLNQLIRPPSLSPAPTRKPLPPVTSS